MDFKEWEPIYREIIKDFGFSRDKDEESARILSNIIDKKESDLVYKQIEQKIAGKSVIVCGKSAILVKDLEDIFVDDKILKDKTIIAADGATSLLFNIDPLKIKTFNGYNLGHFRHHILPDIIVTDLDGNIDDILLAEEEGSLVVIHAHGDNIEKIKKYAPKFKRAIGTTQSRPFDNIYNFGGFTDGDRCVFLAKHFGASQIRLAGFDFDDQTVAEIKKKKLKWAKRLLLMLNIEDLRQRDMPNIKQNFCPACGKNVDLGDTIDGICIDCFIKSASLLECRENDEVVICKRCGAFYDAEWKISISEEDAVLKYVSSRIKTSDELEEKTLDLTVERLDSNRVRVNGILNGKIKGKSIKKAFNCTVYIKYAICDSCSRISGGYYESILQIRANKRGLDDKEQYDIEKIVKDYVVKRYEEGDKKSFITKIEELDEGVDFYLGSKSVSRQICNVIRLKYGGEIQRSSKLVGVRDGKNLYRVTYSLRFFKISKGDVVFFKEKFIHAIKVAKNIEGRDLKSGKTVTIEGSKNNINSIKILGNIKDALDTDLLSIRGDKIKVVDPYTNKNVEILKPYFIDRIKNNKVEVIKTSAGLLAIPPKYYNISIKR